MRKLDLLSVILVASLVLSSALAHAAIVETFDSGTRGWTGVDPSGDWYLADPANPGGYIVGTEPSSSSGDGYFVAPQAAPWTGNWSPYVGGTLKFDLAILSGTNYSYNAWGVLIYGESQSVHWTNASPFWTGWKTFTVPLTAASFNTTETTFSSVMSNVTSFQILGEYIYGPEQEALDNVIITGSREAVPVPPSLLLLGPALFGLGAFRTRFRKS